MMLTQLELLSIIILLCFCFHNFTYDYRVPLTQWWGKEIIGCLPYAHMFKHRTVTTVLPVSNREADWVDAYSDFYRPHEFIPMNDLYSYNISHSIRLL